MAPAHPTDATADAFVSRLEGEASEAERAEVPAVLPGALPRVHRRADGRGLRVRPGLRGHGPRPDRAAARARGARGPRRCRADHGGAGESSGHDRRAAPGPRRPLPSPPRPDRRLGPRRPRRLGGARAFARRPAAGRPRRARRVRRPVAPAVGDHRDLRIHPAWRAGRHLPDRRMPARRRARPRPQGRRLGPPQRRRPRSRAAPRVPGCAMPRPCRGRRCGTRSRSWRPRSANACSRSAGPAEAPRAPSSRRFRDSSRR